MEPGTLLTLPNNQKLNVVEDESLIPYVSFLEFLYDDHILPIAKQFLAETEKHYASVVNNMSTKCCRGRSFTTSYSTSRYTCCNGILRSKRLYDCNKTKYGYGHSILLI